MKIIVNTSLALVFLSGCGQQPVSELSSNDLRWNFKSSEGRSFSDGERKLIEKSMNILAKRVDQNKVWSCAKNNFKRWKVQNSGQNITDVNRFKSFVNMHQSAFTSSKIPRVVFVPFFENSLAHGRAFVGGFVKAEFEETISLVPIYNFTGEFEVKLNQKHLSSSTWNDPDEWAGTIFHEMLHQMGYGHDKSNYEDDMFITVLGDCVTSNGTFQSRSEGLSLTGKAWPIPD